MRQSSIFDKKQYRSNKDITLSIGREDRVTITFRNHSWERITKSDRVAVWLIDNQSFKFGDPAENQDAKSYKLVKNNGNTPAVRESTRYVQISGTKNRELAEIVRSVNGKSYNLPKTKEIDVNEPTKKPEKVVTPPTAPEPEIVAQDEPAPTGFKARRKNLYTDARFFLATAQSPEERVAVWNALAALYSGLNDDNGGES